MTTSQTAAKRSESAPVGWSSKLDPWLAVLLEQHQVGYETVDPATAQFGGVPVDGERFNKQRTNLLLQQTTVGSGALAFVDSDLTCQGTARTVAAALSGPCQKNWRRLRLPLSPGSINEAICAVLNLLGSPLAPLVGRIVKPRPSAMETAAGHILTALGEAITPATAATAYQTSFRQGLARQLAVLPTRETLPRSVLLWGRAGCGLDHLMLAAVHPLLDAHNVTQVFRVSAARLVAGCIFAQELDAALMDLFADAAGRDGCLLLVQDLDVAVTGSPVSHSILCGALDEGVRMFATVRSENVLERLRDHEATARRMVAVHVPAADTDQTVQVLRHLAEQSQIDVAEAAFETAVHISDAQGAAQPAAAVGLLGAAIAEATWAGRTQLGPEDLVGVLQSQWPE